MATSNALGLLKNGSFSTFCKPLSFFDKIFKNSSKYKFVQGLKPEISWFGSDRLPTEPHPRPFKDKSQISILNVFKKKFKPTSKVENQEILSRLHRDVPTKHRRHVDHFFVQDFFLLPTFIGLFSEASFDPTTHSSPGRKKTSPTTTTTQPLNPFSPDPSSRSCSILTRWTLGRRKKHQRLFLWVAKKFWRRNKSWTTSHVQKFGSKKLLDLSYAFLEATDIYFIMPVL